MLRTPNGMEKTLRTPNSGFRTINSVTALLDEVLSEVQAHSPRKILFRGERVEEVSSYVAGWMVSQGMDVIVLDGANRFNPYMVSSFARNVLIPPEGLLKKIRIARAFTCYQMAALMGEKLVSFLKEEGAIDQSPRPWVILLGPVNTFLDEDVPEREAGPLLERSLRRVESLAAEGIPFFLFQRLIPSNSRRTYLMKKLFQFSSLVWKISLEDQRPTLRMEKGPKHFNENCKLQNEKCKFPEKILPL
jgi:hypothetical protein